MAVACRIADNEVTLIDNLSFEQPKTRDMAAILKALKLDRHEPAGGRGRARRERVQEPPQPGGVSVLPVADLNALNVLRPKRLLMTTSALDAFPGKSERPEIGSATTVSPWSRERRQP